MNTISKYQFCFWDPGTETGLVNRLEPVCLHCLSGCWPAYPVCTLTPLQLAWEDRHYHWLVISHRAKDGKRRHQVRHMAKGMKETMSHTTSQHKSEFQKDFSSASFPSHPLPCEQEYSCDLVQPLICYFLLFDKNKNSNLASPIMKFPCSL